MNRINLYIKYSSCKKKAMSCFTEFIHHRSNINPTPHLHLRFHVNRRPPLDVLDFWPTSGVDAGCLYNFCFPGLP